MTQANRPPGGPSGPTGAGAPGGPPLASTVGPVELPPLTAPAHKMSRLAKVTLGFCGLILFGYGYVAFTGWEPAAPERDEIPASVRSSPGGYRSFHFWHSGYHGGK